MDKPTDGENKCGPGGRADRVAEASSVGWVAKWPLATAQRAIVMGGGLAMVYTQLTTSPLVVEYARSLGASSLHIGILGALPTGLFFMQFLAALLASRIRYRRWPWFAVSVLQRLTFLPVAFGPIVMPEVSGSTWITLLIVGGMLNHALLHLSTPLWMSWMGDYLPRDGLSRFWGRRHLWQQWTAFASLALAALVFWKSGLAMQNAFAVLMAVGTVLGLVDLLLFLKIDEPPVPRMERTRLRDTFLIPLHDRQFRSYVEYTCFWHFAAMIGAPFIGVYLLEQVGMSLFGVLMLWAISWIGGAMVSDRVGAIADRFGHRPLLIGCTALKSLNMLAMLCTPANPTWAFWFLVPVLMMDAQLNAGINIANQGYLLKYSPSEGRAMFIASGTALAGMVGGVTAILAGYLLTRWSEWSPSIGGYPISGYSMAFALSAGMRLAALGLARRVQEPESHGTRVVLQTVFLEARSTFAELRRGIVLASPGPRMRRIDGKTADGARVHESTSQKRAA
ncbi:MAG: MFS transporter [Planctomycetes bacterium]|nr:MFS transporter [Planctomycetota bacterium]